MDKLRAKNRSERGSSLIGVIIAGSVLSVVGLAASNLIVQQANSITYMEDRLSSISLTRELGMRLSEDGACTESLSGKAIQNDQKIDHLKNALGVIFADTSSGSSSSVYDRLGIKNIRLENQTATNSPNSSGIMNLIIEIERERKVGGPVELRSAKIPVTVTTAANGTIQSCGLFGSNNDGKKKCGESLWGDAKKSNCNGSGNNCTTSEYQHGDHVSKVTESGHNDGGDRWTISSKYTCFNGSWVYTGRSGDGTPPSRL